MRFLGVDFNQLPYALTLAKQCSGLSTRIHFSFFKKGLIKQIFNMIYPQFTYVIVICVKRFDNLQNRSC